MWVEIIFDGSYFPLDFPLELFEIIDPRASEYWVLGKGGLPNSKVKKPHKHYITLWPQEFYTDYFHDCLSEQEAPYVEMFQNVYNKLEKEFQ